MGDEIYLGKYYYNKVVKGKLVSKQDWKLAPVTHEPIIDDTTFLLAQKYLDASKHEKINDNGHTYLLSGLLRCSHCFDPENDKDMAHWNGGRKEIKKGGNNFTYFYQCSRKNKSKSYKPCGTLPLPADGIEKYITDYTFKLLNNPSVVYEHNLKLTSTKQEVKLLQRKHVELKKSFNSLDMQKERLKEQHKLGLLTTENLQLQLQNLKERQAVILVKLEEIGKQIQQDTNTTNSLLTLELFSEKYKDFIEKAKTDRTTMYQLIHKLFEEIVVYSTGLGPNSAKIAGKKREGQAIPTKLHIKVRLPKEILKEIEGKKLQEIYNSPNGVQGENPLMVRR